MALKLLVFQAPSNNKRVEKLPHAISKENGREWHFLLREPRREARYRGAQNNHCGCDHQLRLDLQIIIDLVHFNEACLVVGQQQLLGAITVTWFARVLHQGLMQDSSIVLSIPDSPVGGTLRKASGLVHKLCHRYNCLYAKCFFYCYARQYLVHMLTPCWLHWDINLICRCGHNNPNHFVARRVVIDTIFYAHVCLSLPLQPST